MDLLDRLQKALGEDCGLTPQTKILVGFSGGPDSLCLLHGLASLGRQVVAAHFDHGLRQESPDEAAKAVAMARSLGVECLNGCGETVAFARQNSLSLEEAARTLRYRFLFAQARLCGADALAVAHNADDQVETVLMHLLRGAGLSGLKGMTPRAILPEWDAGLPLVRPLLGVWRKEIEAYNRRHGLVGLQDPSNQELTFFRNRLRHELIPSLQTYNPRVREVLWRTSKALADDHALLEKHLDAAWIDCRSQAGEGYVGLRMDTLRGMASGAQRGLLRRALAGLRPGLRDIGYEALERAVNFLQKPSRSRQVDWISGLRLFQEGEILYIMEEGADLPHPWPRVGREFTGWLPLAGRMALGNGWILTAEEAEESAAQGGEWLAVVDADRLEWPLRVRVGRTGERWQPLGMESGRMKLSDYWINSGLPKRARSGWPLVCSGQQIAWIPGYRPAHFCRVTDQTLRKARLRLAQPE